MQLHCPLNRDHDNRCYVDSVCDQSTDIAHLRIIEINFNKKWVYFFEKKGNGSGVTENQLTSLALCRQMPLLPGDQPEQVIHADKLYMQLFWHHLKPPPRSKGKDVCPNIHNTKSSDSSFFQKNMKKEGEKSVVLFVLGRSLDQ